MLGEEYPLHYQCFIADYYKFEIMHVNLKNLKTTKGVRKEYKFLKPLSELIIDEYGEILESFDIRNYEEAIKEILKKYTYVACYTNNTDIETKYISSHYRPDVSTIKYKENEKLTLDKVQLYLSGFQSNHDDTLKNRATWWGTAEEFLIKNVYIVTDKKAFEEFVLEYLLKEEEKAIKSTKERTEKTKEELAKVKARTELYGVNYADSSASDDAIRLIEIIETADKKEQFKLAKDLINDLSCDY